MAIVVWGLQEHPSRLIAKETGESLEDTAEARLMPWALHSIRSEGWHANAG